MALPLLKSLDLLQVQWKGILDPIVANPILQGVAVNSIQLNSGVEKAVPTTLGRMQLGWFLTDNLNNAVVYRTQAFNANILYLKSSADTTINLWCF